MHSSESVSEGAATRLRDLTFGSVNSLGPLSVFRSRWTRTRGCGLVPVVSVAGVACSKAASGSIGRPIRRAVIAARPAAGGPAVATSAGEPYLAGERTRARFAAGSNAGGIGGGFRWSFCPNRRPRAGRRVTARRRPPSPQRARASAQQQFPRIFRFGRVSGRVATSVFAVPSDWSPQRFCCGCAVEALRRVLDREARYRQRRRPGYRPRRRRPRPPP